MSSTRVEFLIKGLDRYDIVAVSDFPYRLNRTAFVVTADKMKALGGTFSTKIKLTRDKGNNRIFVGKTDFKSFGKFNESTDYPAIIKEDGAVIARGVFRLERSTSRGYEGTFFDSNSSWIDDLSKIKLNRLGYVNDSPTWLVPFDGAITFDEVNDLSNRETDFVCPTIIYNNTPIKDFLDFTQNQIWGEYEDDGQGGNTLVTPPLSFPSDFKVVKGFPNVLRHGLKFDHFPPALYYRNVIERVFAEIGLSVDCPLFYQDDFNALIWAYTGDGYIYNWANIGSPYSSNPTVFQNVNWQNGLSNIDEFRATEPATPATGTSINKLMLPPTDNAPTRVWISEEILTFKFANLIKNDSFGTGIDKAALTNTFERNGLYQVPADGKYKISVQSQIDNKQFDFSYYEPFNFYWDGRFLFNAFGGWDSESNVNLKPAIADRWFGWDDCVLLVLRADANGVVSEETYLQLYEWMNGFSKDFVNNENDCIAYISPKRWVLKNGGQSIDDKDVKGSPYTKNNSEVKVLNLAGQSVPYVGHNAIEVDDPKRNQSNAKIEIELNLNKGEHVKIAWVSLANIYGFVVRQDAGGDLRDHAAYQGQQIFGSTAFDSNVSEWQIQYCCGEYDLDLAANLPDITAKEFIASFMKQFNLHYFVEDRTISFYPLKQYYSKVPYDITDRVDFDDTNGEAWISEPIITPSVWAVGYDNDKNDRLLKNDTKEGCTGQSSDLSGYANVEFINDNTYKKNAIREYNLFSATKFIESSIAINPFGFGLDNFPYSFPTTTSPISSASFITGFTLDVIAANDEFRYKFPSIQSEDSYNKEKFGDWFLDFNYVPRLLHHFGTANQYAGINPLDIEKYGCMIDMPRADIDYMNLKKYWFRPTVSGFDGENDGFTGISYPTLRYDGDGGLYERYFENLLEFFNKSERLQLRAALTPKDWNNLKGDKKVRFLGQLYRLMEIKDYDPVTRNKCIIYLLKEV